MAKPIILAVDDDPVVLAAIERDLRLHYRATYRVLGAKSGQEGLETARELAARNAQVALFLVDQRMPGMTGLELLAAATRLHPEARRVLLTAYADTDVAIAGINQVGLDHYLVKPWDPPADRQDGLRSAETVKEGCQGGIDFLGVHNVFRLSGGSRLKLPTARGMELRSSG